MALLAGPPLRCSETRRKTISSSSPTSQLDVSCTKQQSAIITGPEPPVSTLRSGRSRSSGFATTPWYSSMITAQTIAGFTWRLNPGPWVIPWPGFLLSKDSGRLMDARLSVQHSGTIYSRINILKSILLNRGQPFMTCMPCTASAGSILNRVRWTLPGIQRISETNRWQNRPTIFWGCHSRTLNLEYHAPLKGGPFAISMPA